MTYYLFSLKKANSSVLSIRGKFIVEITTRRTLGTPGQKYIIDKDVSQQACLQATATTLGLTPLLSRVISDSFLRRNLITSQRSTGHFKTWPLANGPSRIGTFNLVSSEPAISVPNGPSGLSAPLCGVFLYYESRGAHDGWDRYGMIKGRMRATLGSARTACWPGTDLRADINHIKMCIQRNFFQLFGRGALGLYAKITGPMVAMANHAPSGHCPQALELLSAWFSRVLPRSTVAYRRGKHTENNSILE